MTPSASRRRTKELLSVPELKLAARTSTEEEPSGSFFLERALRQIPDDTTENLMVRLTTTKNPLLAWALHFELDERNVPPCLRPGQERYLLESKGEIEQMRFITVLADLLWLAKRNPGHETAAQRQRGIFKTAPCSEQWHRAVLWAYQQAGGLGHLLAQNLALADAQRCFTATMPTKDQTNVRRALQKRFCELRDALYADARQRPDKSGRTDPGAVAERRLTMLKAFVLLDRNYAATLEYLKDIEGVVDADGQVIDRRTLRKQLTKAALTCGASKLVFGSTRAPLLPVRGGRQKAAAN